MPDRSTTSLREAVVGSHVLVRRRRGRVPTITTVTVAGAAKVQLADGSHWTRSGAEWGHGRDGGWAYDRPSAYLIVDLAAVEQEVAKEQAAFTLEEARHDLAETVKRRSGTFSLEDCAAIMRIISGEKEVR